MSHSAHSPSESRTTDHSGMGQRGGSLRLVQASCPPGPRLTDPSWAPPDATIGMAGNEHEARLVYRLRYRVYVHELGATPEGVDRERNELVGPLDPWSCLWYAREGEALVGTIAQTIIGPGFDLTQLPSALELDAFPCSVSCPLGFSSRFAIAPDHRSTWVLPSLARYTYAHGRERGAKFDFMATNPGLVPLFERLGYVRYTATAFHEKDVGLLIPMVLPATDHDHLRRVRSACLPAAAHFPAEPEWGAWLRANRPIIGVYYGADPKYEQRSTALAQRTHLPLNVAVDLSTMSFVHHFPAGTPLRRKGDRVTCTFVALDGQLSGNRIDHGAESTPAFAPDGVAFSRTAIRCDTDAVVLCVPDTAVVRLMRRYPEHGARLQELLEPTSPADMQAAQILR